GPSGSVDAHTAYETISRSPVSRATATASSNCRSDSAMSSRIVTDDARHTRRRTSSALGPSARAASMARSSSFTAAKSESSRSLTIAPRARAEASSAGGTPARSARDEPASLALGDIRRSRRSRQRVEPEVPPDDARLVKKSLDAGRRRVDARGDDAVKRRRHDRARTLIDEHVDVLLHEERISLRPRDDLVHRSVRPTRQKSTHELLGVGDVERLERDR